jgi:hypothetical protein
MVTESVVSGGHRGIFQHPSRGARAFFGGRVPGVVPPATVRQPSGLAYARAQWDGWVPSTVVRPFGLTALASPSHN